ncbi:MAG: hypothetical protein OXI56_05110 [bacterium]|nr:hypothetical protein [bacterium]MDE0601157.1 hypothetical protein [bacterium]
MSSRTLTAVVISVAAGALVSIALSAWLGVPILLLAVVAPLALGAGLASRR